MTAQQRLDNILWQTSLSAFVTFSGGAPAVCLTEAGPQGLNYLLGSRGYQPWALVFDRQAVYNAGGGPVWYARTEQYNALDSAQRHWAVHYAPGSDWVEEREWRVPRPVVPGGATPTVSLDELGLVAVIVGDPNWIAARYLDHTPQPYAPPALFRVPRWWRNPANDSFMELPPLGSL
ncbi:hypothetical protein [Saccharothrix longispora]|uniref:hypothetical protein n=1 Tax=Saccharothrix longispora TaxID=33920 RepID=UPI0028FD35FA|nr:hypothetical protein [Saccharothrix longispora]MDU0294416.1 hypothetical protein [Saccharothrix longispora]